MATADRSKPPARMGRPPVDSEMVRARLERGLLDQLDAYVAATAGVKRVPATSLLTEPRQACG